MSDYERKRWVIPKANPKYKQWQQNDSSGKSGITNETCLQNGEIWTKEIFKVVPGSLFQALLKENEHILTITNYLCYLNILCMPVVRSPWLVGMVHPHPSLAYHNSFQVLWDLMFLKMFVQDCAFQTGSLQSKKVQVIAAELDLELNQETLTLDKTLKEGIFGPHADGKINEKNAVYQFIKKLELYTLRLINLIECFLWKTLVESREIDISLEECLTPSFTPSAKLLIGPGHNLEQWKTLIGVNQHYFKLRNAMYLAATNRKGKNIDYFGYKTLPNEVFAAMGNQKGQFIYNAYLLGGTAKKYFDMLNVHFK